MQLIYALIFSGIAASLAGETVDEALERGAYKEAIAICTSAIDHSNSKSEWMVKLAIAYSRDQDEVRALTTFLSALDSAETCSDGTHDERYDAALALYLNGKDPRTMSEQLLKEYPCDAVDATDLALVAAAAYANLNRFDAFFDHFYHAYLFHSDHWLAHKTRAALHVRLIGRLRDDDEKERHRRYAHHHASQALERYNGDTALYKWVITLADAHQRATAIRNCIDKILDDAIVVARSDIAFFIQHAVDADEVEHAQRFLDKAKEWYAFSRVVTAAQSYLDQKKL